MTQLKSGGPNMSVARIEDGDAVLNARCSWLDDNKKQTRTFPIALFSELDLRRYCCRDSACTRAICDFKFETLKRCRHTGRISSTSV
jgi:uncharacterized protein YodC (DUF2158 family)